MKNFRTLIIDDEADARETIRQLCQSERAQLNIVGEASSVAEAVLAIGICKPELVFLDINMQDGTGFDFLDKIKNYNFHLVFTTAHDAFALKAFQYNALNYLLKPIDPAEFSETLSRIADLKKLSKEQVQNVVQQFQAGSTKRIILDTGKMRIAVLLSEIYSIHAISNFTKVCLQNGNAHLVNTSLKQFEQMLYSDEFFRCHHSYIINIRKIHSIECRNGEFLAHFVNGETLPVSRRKSKELNKRFTDLS